MEMHIVHLIEDSMKGDSEFFASAFGIIFDTDRYTVDLDEEQREIIDDFFDSMDLDRDDEPYVGYVPIGDLMNLVDSSNRWVYKGSLTTPPCTGNVYFNVVRNVYPISDRHLYLLRKKLNNGKNDLASTGNYREI
jgi:hypothetical protein